MRWRAAVVAAGVLAATTPPGAVAAAAGEEGFSLTVSPARTISTPVDGRVAETFRVSNSGTEAVHVRAVLGTFVQRPDGGVAFVAAASGTAASWASVSPRAFDLGPGEKRAVSVAARLPGRLEPGDHQIGVTFVVPAGDGAGNVAVNRGIGAQLLVPVPGAADRRIDVTDVDLPWLADGGPIRVRTTVRNRGNVHQDFGGARPLTADVGPGQRIAFGGFTVLRESTRVVETDWSDPPLFCFCRVVVRAADGRGGTTFATERVVVVPLRLIAAGLLLAVGAALVMRGRRRLPAVPARALVGPT